MWIFTGLFSKEILYVNSKVIFLKITGECIRMKVKSWWWERKKIRNSIFVCLPKKGQSAMVNSTVCSGNWMTILCIKMWSSAWQVFEPGHKVPIWMWNLFLSIETPSRSLWWRKQCHTSWIWTCPMIFISPLSKFSCTFSL